VKRNFTSKRKRSTKQPIVCDQNQLQFTKLAFWLVQQQ